MLLTENNNQMENTANDQNKNNEMRITSKKTKEETGTHCSQSTQHKHIEKEKEEEEGHST